MTGLFDIWNREGLRQRIRIFFVGFVLIVATLYAYTSIWAIKFTEASLVTRVMQDELVNLHRLLDEGEPIRLAAGYRLYGTYPSLPPVPDNLQNLPDGFCELEASPAVFVMTHITPEGTLLLTLDQEKFEEDEQLFVVVILMSVLGILLISLVFVNALTLLIFRPVEILTDAVERQMTRQRYEPLTVTVTNDEIGNLARLCDRAIRELHEALDREKAFTGDVSHELRTPLTVIRTSCELLEMRSEDPVQKNQIRRLLRACDSMQELIDLFLEFSRSRNADRSKESVNRGATLAEVFDELDEIWRPKSREKGLALTLSIQHEDDVLYPALYLKTVLSNLLRNALAYTQEGGVGLYADGRRCVLIDSGHGIPAEDRERIFAPYDRGSRQPRNSDGVGLGLSIVIRMADRLGWQVALLSEEELLTGFPSIAEQWHRQSTTVGAVFLLTLVSVNDNERRRRDEREADI